MKKYLGRFSNEFLLLLVIASVLGLANSLSDMPLNNYYKDAYDVTSVQRGIIEFPREAPGVLLIFIISALSFLGDFRIAIIAQILCFVGIAVLGFITPPFAIMLVFIFINSLGKHMYIPLADSIGMSLIKDKANFGRHMGIYKSMTTIFSLIAGVLVFAGFKVGFFSFFTKIKWNFVISGVFFFIAFVLFLVMNKKVKQPTIVRQRPKLVFKKEYKYYYILACLNGFQRQIILVFGPWVLIELLGQGADTMSLLGIVGSFLGIFFLRYLGKWIDRFGVKKLLFADALSFIGVYIMYGLLSGGFSSGKLSLVGVPLVLACALYISDNISMQMGMVRIVYLKNIALSHSDITPTISAGLSIDHILSIGGAYLGGIVWTSWGPQYVFFVAAALSLGNLLVAFLVKIPHVQKTEEIAEIDL